MNTEPIAIVGLGCVLPDALDVPSLLANLRQARYSITEVEAERWDPADYFAPKPREGKTYSKIGGWVRGFTFDGQRFRIPPATLARTDEVQRWAIDVADQALRDAGCHEHGSDFDAERCAVVFGTSVSEAHRATDRRVDRAYVERLAREAGLGAAGAARLGGRLVEGIPPITEDTMPGELPNIVTGRVAQALDLHGPNYTTDAACASTLAAVLDGCMLLATGHADWVLVGGADRSMDPAAFAKFCAIGALSAEGSFPFDRRASGFVMAEGAGAVLLRRLRDAVAAGRRIYAVITSVGAASDGRGKSLTAPNPRGQETALRRAYQLAGFSPESLDLVEAHGTSTQIGDWTEVKVLTRLLNGRTRPLALGSAKGGLGHLKAAAGIASLLKVALALHHREVLPTAGFAIPNPRIPWSSAPLRVPVELEPWPGVEGRPPRAGLSAFGFGGANFHLTLEGAPDGSHPVLVSLPAPAAERPEHEEQRALEGGVLCFAGRSVAEAVAAARSTMAGWLAAGPLFDEDAGGRRLSQAAWEQLQRAGDGPVRLALTAGSWRQARERCALLERVGDPRQTDFLAAQGIFLRSGDPPAAAAKTAFLFPGQGSQYLGMLQDLRRRYGVVEELWTVADQVVGPATARALSRIVAPEPWPASAEERAAAEARLAATEHCQPAVLAADLALLELLAQHGIRPDMVAGHSLGEYAALVAAGAMSLADAARAAAARGTFMAAAGQGGSGAMASLGASMAEIEEILVLCPGYVAIANHNSPRRTVISGEARAVDAAIGLARERGLQAALLPVSHAFHSRLVAAADEPMRRFFASVEFRSPRLPVASSVDGLFYPHGDETGARQAILARLGGQASRPVEWTAAVRALYTAGARIFVECGPKAALTTLNGETLAGLDQLSLATNHPKQGGIASWLAALGRLWVAGMPLVLPPLASPLHTAAFRSAAELPPRLAGAGPSRPIVAPPASAAAKPPAGGAWDEVAAAAAELCGYPARLLTPPLRLDCDLGMNPEAVAAMCAKLGIDRRQLAEPTLAAAAAAAAAAGKAAAAANAPSLPSAALAAEEAAVARLVVGVLSERTGYPPETLGADLDLEGELGIDTVKQAELLGQVHAHYGLPPPQGAVLAELNTIAKLARAIAEQLVAREAPPAPAGAAEPAPAERPPTPQPRTLAPHPAPLALASFFFAHRERLAATASPLAAAGGLVAVTTGDGASGELAEGVAARLRQRGFEPRIVAPGESLGGGEVVGLIHLDAANAEAHPPAAPEAAWKHASGLVHRAFAALRAAAPTRFAASVTRLDGAHGFRRGGGNPIPLGVHAVLKSYARELPLGRLRCYDLDPVLPPRGAARRLVDDLLDAGGPPEIGLGARGRVRLVYAPAAPGLFRANAAGTADLARAAARPGLRTLDASDVFLVSGGAGGITSACLIALAERLHGGRFALLGRTPLDPRSDELAALDDVELQAYRWRFAERLGSAGMPATPVAVERAWQPLARGRDVMRTLTALAAAGASAIYLPCDVTDGPSVEQAVAECRRRLGPATVVVHAAGLERSRQLHGKSDEEIESVLAVKVAGWWNLRAATRGDPVHAMVSFSSVVGRFGNAGQADYAAGNAILSAAAQQAAGGSGRRHLALAWTAWAEAGMAARGEVLERLGEAGVEPLSLAAGSQAFVDALDSGLAGEVLVCGKLGSLADDADFPAPPAPGSSRRLRGPRAPAAGGDSAGFAGPDGGLVDRISELVPGERLRAHRRFDLGRDRFLDDHRIGGRPWIPGVLGLAGFAEAALRLHPGLSCCGFADVSFDMPLKLTGDFLDTEILAETADGGEGALTLVRCRWESRLRALAGAPCGGRPRVHFRGTCLLRPAPALLAAGTAVRAGTPRVTAAEIYRRYFHGPSFRVHGGALRLSAGALEALVDRRPAPLAVGMQHGISAWPLVLEAAVQNAGLLAMIGHGVVALPVAIGRVHLGAVPPPRAPLFTRARPRGQDLLYDCEVVGIRGTRVATLEGLRFKAVGRLSDELRVSL